VAIIQDRFIVDRLEDIPKLNAGTVGGTVLEDEGRFHAFRSLYP